MRQVTICRSDSQDENATFDLKVKTIKDVKSVFFYDAETQFENLGDLVINKILLGELRKYGNVIINLKAVPDWYNQRLNVSSSEKFLENREFGFHVFVEGLRCALASNTHMYYVQTPGHYSGGTAGSFKTTIRKILYYLLLKTVGVRVCRFGTSIGCFSEERALLERWQSKFMHYYSVRDSLSMKQAKNLSIHKPQLFPDFAWLLNYSRSEESISFANKKNVIFSFRSLNSTVESEGAHLKNFWDTLDNIVDLVGHKLRKEILVTHQVKRDSDFSREIFERYKDTYDIKLVESQLDESSAKELYSGACLTFSNRLHVLMIAMAYGSLPIALISPKEHQKILGIFLDSKLDDLILSFDKSSLALSKLDFVLSNYGSLVQSILNAHEVNSKISRELMKKTLHC